MKLHINSEIEPREPLLINDIKAQQLLFDHDYAFEWRGNRYKFPVFMVNTWVYKINVLYEFESEEVEFLYIWKLTLGSGYASDRCANEAKQLIPRIWDIDEIKRWAFEQTKKVLDSCIVV